MASVSDVYYTGVRCTTPGVAHSWAYDGTDFVKSEGSQRNSAWCPGEPNGNCSGEQCIHVNYSSGRCWNDIGCANPYFYMCGMGICEREQVI